MANVLIIKRSAVAAKVPTTGDLQLGELAINTYDGKLYTKRNNGSDSIVEFLSTASVLAIANGGTGSTTAAGAATNLGLGTGDSPQFTAVNIGHASDTTITRSAAGVLAVEGGVIPKENRANTFTDTQYMPRLIVGNTGGSVGLTTNDGYGNANLTFNHVAGVPDQAGSSGRIHVNVDSTTAFMSFSLANSVSSGVAIGTTEVFGLSTTGVFIKPGGTETFRFNSNGSLSIGSAGTGYGTAGQFLQSNGNAAPSWANSPIPSGTKMLFQQTAAPTGWTKDTTHNDKALRVVSGTVGTGGTVAFSTAMASRTVSGTSGATTLDDTMIPGHTHKVYATYATNTTATGTNQNRLTGFSGTTQTTPGNGTTFSTGGGGSHSHSFSTTLDMAVQYVDIIIATKD